MTLFISLSVIMGALIFNFGCNGAQPGEASFGSVSLPNLNPNNPNAPPGVSTGLLDDDQYFYVGLDTKDQDIIAHVHSTLGFDKPCGIDKDSTANEDITCIIEMPEADIFAKNIVLQHNIPENMCRYLYRVPYTFYNYESGVGPSSIVIDTIITRNASNDITGTSYSCNIDGLGADPGCANAATTLLELKDLNVAQTTPSYKCIYDHTDTSGLPNCCVGNYTLVQNTIDPLGNTSSSQNLSWNSDTKLPDECYSGSGMINPLVSADGKTKMRPGSGLVEFAQNSINSKHTLLAPNNFLSIPIESRANMINANFYGQAADHIHTGFVDLVTTSTKPYFISPIDDRSGSSISSTNDGYTYICYDQAFEIKHRITAYVRDWDTYQDFVNYVNSQGTVVVPDRSVADVEGPNCTGVTGSCSDLGDLDDFLDKIVPGAPASYDTSAVTNRTLYYPKIKYKAF